MKRITWMPNLSILLKSPLTDCWKKNMADILYDWALLADREHLRTNWAGFNILMRTLDWQLSVRDSHSAQAERNAADVTVYYLHRDRLRSLG